MPDEPPTISAVTPEANLSLGARLVNVFATPGEVFEQVRRGPYSFANWLVPAILSCVCGIVFALVVFSQPAIQQQLRDKQDKQLEKLVASGKLKEAQVEDARAMMEKFGGPTMVKFFASAGAVVISFAWPFLVGLGLWLLGTKIFKADFGYLQAVEVAGLAGLVAVVGTILKMLLVVNYGNLAVTPGPSLLVGELDPTNRVHMALASLNLTTFWYVGLLALGVAKLSRASFAKGAIWLFGVWFVITGAGILLGVMAGA